LDKPRPSSKNSKGSARASSGQGHRGGKKAAKPKYKKIRDLGAGANGAVSLVECDQDGKLYAKKVIDCSHLDEEDKKVALNEAWMMKALDHPFIVTYRECYRTKKDLLCIIMEYVDGGDLKD